MQKEKKEKEKAENIEYKRQERGYFKSASRIGPSIIRHTWRLMNYKWYIPVIKQTGHIDFSDLSY